MYMNYNDDMQPVAKQTAALSISETECNAAWPDNSGG